MVPKSAVAETWALVSCLPTVARTPAAPAKTQQEALTAGWVLVCELLAPMFEKLRLPLILARASLIWLPAILAYIGLFYMCLALVHVCSDTGVIVDVAFYVVDLVPVYFEHVGSKVLAALRRQLAARFR